MAQADPAMTCPTRPSMLRSRLKVQILPSNAMSKKMSSPAYMLPNNRMPKETPLAMYSMMFSTKLNGAKYHFAPNGADRSSCTNPPRPFTLKL